MNKITKLFLDRKAPILSVYFTAGFPEINSTITIIEALAVAGADLIEIGMPFSDPVADGPVIQQSNTQALENGITLSLLFEQLKGVRQITDIPLVLMGYLNPIVQYGMENFLVKAKEAGIDGVIIPDMPLNEYEKNYQQYFIESDTKIIFLIAPDSTPERIKHIDKLTTGFLYMVTSAATTGGQKEFEDERYRYFEMIKKMKLHNPVVAGFGIHDKTSFDAVCNYTDGAIIGSAFIKAIAHKNGDLKSTIQKFVKNIRP